MNKVIIMVQHQLGIQKLPKELKPKEMKDQYIIEHQIY